MPRLNHTSTVSAFFAGLCLVAFFLLGDGAAPMLSSVWRFLCALTPALLIVVAGAALLPRYGVTPLP